MEPVYLGDAVYATLQDSGVLMLTTDSHKPEEAGNTIYLEPEVMEALGKYLLKYPAPTH